MALFRTAQCVANDGDVCVLCGPPGQPMTAWTIGIRATPSILTATAEEMNEKHLLWLCSRHGLVLMATTANTLVAPVSMDREDIEFITMLVGQGVVACAWVCVRGCLCMCVHAYANVSCKCI